MTENLKQRLVKQLINAHSMEKRAIQLLDKGAAMIGDEEVGRIFRAHRLQTEEHERYVAERLTAYGKSPSKVRDVAMQAGALGIGLPPRPCPIHLCAARPSRSRSRTSRSPPTMSCGDWRIVPATPRQWRWPSGSSHRRRPPPNSCAEFLIEFSI